MKLLLLLTLCLPLAAQDRLWRASLVAVAASSAADYASSLGRWERNALLRGADGRFSPVRGVAWKIGPQAALVALQVKTPRYRRLWTVLNFASAGVFGAATVSTVRRK